jgi:hypothetical protein
VGHNFTLPKVNRKQEGKKSFLKAKMTNQGKGVISDEEQEKIVWNTKQGRQDEIHNKVVKQGLWAAAGWGSGGLLFHLGLTHYSPRYAKHTIPFKLFVLCMIPTAAFFTVTDRSAMYEDRAYSAQFSVTTPDDFKQPIAPEFGKLPIREYIKENQYSLVAGMYASLIAGSLAYNFARKEISFTQKLINTRMVGQAGVLVAIGAIAALNLKKEKQVSVDRHFERIVNGSKD